MTQRRRRMQVRILGFKRGVSYRGSKRWDLRKSMHDEREAAEYARNHLAIWQGNDIMLPTALDVFIRREVRPGKFAYVPAFRVLPAAPWTIKLHPVLNAGATPVPFDDGIQDGGVPR